MDLSNTEDYGHDDATCVVCMEPAMNMVPFGDPHKPETSEMVPMCRPCVQNHVRTLWGGNT
jgi:hypothetical protein